MGASEKGSSKLHSSLSKHFVLTEELPPCITLHIQHNVGPTTKCMANRCSKPTIPVSFSHATQPLDERISGTADKPYAATKARRWQTAAGAECLGSEKQQCRRCKRKQCGQ